MQSKPTASNHRKSLPGLAYKPTPTKHIAQRGGRFIVRWSEHGHHHFRPFSSYEAACAFVRDYVQPFKDGEGPLPPSAVAPSKGTGWVYAFRSSGPGEPVKIGWSTDPAKRLRYLATGHPYRIDLVALLPGSRGLERVLHAALGEFRMEGEWFSREAEGALVRLLAGLTPADQGRIALPSERDRP